MSLNFYYHDIANFEELLVEAKGWKYVHPNGTVLVTDKKPGLMLETLITLMMPIAMQRITEENAGEVWARIDMMERLHGSFRYGAVLTFPNRDEMIAEYKARPTNRLKNMLDSAYCEGVRVNGQRGARRDVYFTMEDIMRCVGLSVNVATESRSKFVKRVVTAHMDEQAHEVQKRRADAMGIAKAVARTLAST